MLYLCCVVMIFVLDYISYLNHPHLVSKQILMRRGHVHSALYLFSLRHVGLAHYARHAELREHTTKHWCMEAEDSQRCRSTSTLEVSIPRLVTANGEGLSNDNPLQILWFHLDWN